MSMADAGTAATATAENALDSSNSRDFRAGKRFSG
jgi:hypothetical protein